MLAPYVPGSSNVPSTAYCFLYKLFTLKLTRKQLEGMLKSKESPYIRALGFLYVRYTIKPQEMLSFIEPYLKQQDEQEFIYLPNQKMYVSAYI